MHCMPRHTPKIGVSVVRLVKMSMLTPESSGLPGPGEMSMPSGSSARMPSRSISS